jgi:uncharacterized protein YjaG (DUF416 family)
MLMPKFDEKRLNDRLTKLNVKQKLAYCFAINYRLLPNYLPFFQEENWGNPVPLVNAMEYLWKILMGEPESIEKIHSLYDSIGEIIPDSDDFSSLNASLAQITCFSVGIVLDNFLQEDQKKLILPASYAVEAVESFVFNQVNKSVEEKKRFEPVEKWREYLDARQKIVEQKIQEHPLMQRELSQQEKELSFIEKHPAMTHDDLLALNALWPNHKKSNLDLPKDA